MSRVIRVWFACLAIAAGMVAGCGSESPDGSERLKAANPSNIHRLTNLYSMFSLQNRGRSPKDEKEFRAFILAMGPERLGRMGIKTDAIDGLFTSERDSQPFTILYGSDAGGSRSQDKGGLAVVMESKGAAGKRQVGFLGTRSTREVKELDEAQMPNLK